MSASSVCSLSRCLNTFLTCSDNVGCRIPISFESLKVDFVQRTLCNLSSIGFSVSENSFISFSI